MPTGDNQPGRLCDDETFIRQIRDLGKAEFARRSGCSERNVYKRIRNLERKFQIRIVGPKQFGPTQSYPHRNDWSITNGVGLVGSDFHLWPGQESLMLRAFKKFCDDLRPQGVCLNGDVLDFPQISRHPPIGWESTPKPQEEIEAAQDHLNDIVKRAKKAEKAWNLGNHDARFETRLATVAPEFAKVAGIHLSDHFPLWSKGWALWINQDVVVKHRFKGGIHATHNNTLWAGKTVVTGHLHSAKVTPLTDYNGTRWGVDSGCVADTDAKQFVDYTEDNPKNWVSAFCVLTFKDGRLLWPELVTPWSDTHVQFRGELIRV